MKFKELKQIATNKFILNELSEANAKFIIHNNLDMDKIITAYVAYINIFDFDDDDTIIDFDLFLDILFTDYNYIRKENLKYVR